MVENSTKNKLINMTKLRYVAQKDTVDWISTYSSAKSPEDPPTKTSPVVGHNL
jgi:hypothetical protein